MLFLKKNRNDWQYLFTKTRQLRKHRVQIFQFMQKYYKDGCNGENGLMVETIQ